MCTGLAWYICQLGKTGSVKMSKTYETHLSFNLLSIKGKLMKFNVKGRFLVHTCQHMLFMRIIFIRN